MPTSLFSSLLLMLFCKFLNKTGAWPWLQCRSDCCFLNCIDRAGFCFFLLSRRRLLSTLCNLSFYPFALSASNISKYYKDKCNFRTCGLLFQFSPSFLCPILSERLGFLPSVRPPLFRIAANFHSFFVSTIS